MIHETFVASTPRAAYDQAVEKYGSGVEVVSAKQVRYEDGEVWSELQIAVPKARFEERSLQIAPTIAADTPEPTLMEVVKSLFVQKGISRTWLDRVLERVDEATLPTDREGLIALVMAQIEAQIRLKPESLEHPKVMMFVGPTGVGKTTTIAKIATRYSYLVERPCTVALINLDNYKMGAIEQLGHYADVMQLEYFSLNDPKAFFDLMHDLIHYDVVLVDTAGMSPYDTQKFIKVVEYINTDTERTREVNLVIPATIKYEDIEDIYKNFSFLGIDSVILTKFDETRHFGALLSFMLEHEVPLSYFSTGQEVPDDLVVANKAYLLSHLHKEITEA